MNSLIEEIFNSREVTTPDGEKIALHSSVDLDEGNLILDVIRHDETIKKTLEVGCAYGLSSLFIAEGLKNRSSSHHTIIDPFQSSDWKNIGVNNLKKVGFDRFTLIEEKSEFALPRLASEEEARYDLVFIDGFHTFDHTLLDCFYATRLLRVGGYLIVDDVGFPAIRRVVDYLSLYPCYSFFKAVSNKKGVSLKRSLANTGVSLIPKAIREKILNKSLLHRINNTPQDMVALKKTAQDERPWNWFSKEF